MKRNIIQDSAVVEFCMELVSFSAEQKGILLNLDVAPKSKQYIKVDERRLKQVVINLLNNAVKFTMKGSIRIELEHVVKNHKYFFAIQVKDTGMGIKAEDLEKLGTEFTMLSTHSAINPNGTGLGLYMCKKFMNLMGGNLDISSVYQKGSVFSALIPIENTSDHQPSETRHEGTSPAVDHILVQPSAIQNCRVLIVDDSPMCRFVIQCLFEKFGIDSDKAQNGKEAISQVQSYFNLGKKYDLILMDINMPLMGGLEAGRILKEMMARGEVPSVPIIGLSGDNKEDITKENMKISFDERLVKPITTSSLRELLIHFDIFIT